MINLDPQMQEARVSRQSYAQQRLWFLNQLDPSDAKHNILIRIYLDGPLKREALEQSFTNLVRRHAILRTRYRDSSDGPVQWAEKEPNCTLNYTDLCDRSAAAQEQEAERLAQVERNNAFDLQQGPVASAHLLSFAPDRHELIFNVHHIAFDGHSGEIFFAELAEGYQAALNGTSLPALAWQYADFAEREPTLLTSQQREKQLAFWRTYLQDMPLNLYWPGRMKSSDRRQGDVQQPNSASSAGTDTAIAKRRRFETAAGTLEQFAQEKSQSLFQTLLTLFSVWLHYLCKQERFLVGTDIHGRTLPEVNGLIGFFVNQLALKCDLSEAPTLSELFSRMRRNTRQAYGHHRLPFDQLVSALAPQRDLSRAPLFQVKLNYQPYRVSTQSIGDAVLSPVRVEQDLAGFDLVLDLTHGDGGIDACLEYSGQLFSENEMTRAMATWQRLLREFPQLLDKTVPDIARELEQWDAQHQQSEQQAQLNRNRGRLSAMTRRARPLSA